MVWIRRGVDWRPNREIDNAVRLMDKTFQREDIFITCGREGFHNPGSFHAQGDAFDMRPISFDIAKMRSIIGPDFDIVDETNHWHIEYDPK